jgi:hypothetical protein
MSKNKPLNKYEEFVASVLARNFNQKIDHDSLRSAAEKVAEAVHVTRAKDAPKRVSYTGREVRA